MIGRRRKGEREEVAGGREGGGMEPQVRRNAPSIME
jgi:hypothetical protein